MKLLLLVVMSRKSLDIEVWYTEMGAETLRCSIKLSNLYRHKRDAGKDADVSYEVEVVGYHAS